MTYDQCMDLVDYLNARFRKAGANPWYKWATAYPITWDKLIAWRERLEKI